MATVIIPAALRKYANYHNKLVVQSTNIKDLLIELTTCYPTLKPHLINGDGNVPPFVNIFVDNHDVRNLQRNETIVREGSVVSIVPAIAGG